MNWQVLSLLTSTTFKTPEKPSFDQSYNSIGFSSNLYSSSLGSGGLTPTSSTGRTLTCTRLRCPTDSSGLLPTVMKSILKKNTKIQIHKNTPPWTTKGKDDNDTGLSNHKTYVTWLQCNTDSNLEPPSQVEYLIPNASPSLGVAPWTWGSSPSTHRLRLVKTRNQTIEV